MPRRATTSAAKARAKGNGTGRAGSGARREREVLEAATRVFHDRGYADASVQDIADELGILKGSLYHYIDSKEDLLYRLLEECHQEIQAILDEVLATEVLTPLERLRAYVTRQVEYTSRHIAEVSIYYHDVDKLSDERRKTVLRQRRVHEQFVVRCIEQARERGEVADGVNPQLAAHYLFGSMIWVYRWYRPGSKVKPPELSASCADFVLAGVTGRS